MEHQTKLPPRAPQWIMGPITPTSYRQQFVEYQTKLPPRAPQWTEVHPLGQNAALFAELNRRKLRDQKIVAFCVGGLIGTIGMIIWSVL